MKPQQARLWSLVLIAQLKDPPAETWLKLPDGGLALPDAWSPQHTSVPSDWTPQVWVSPAEMVVGPGPELALLAPAEARTATAISGTANSTARASRPVNAQPPMLPSTLGLSPVVDSIFRRLSRGLEFASGPS